MKTSLRSLARRLRHSRRPGRRSLRRLLLIGVPMIVMLVALTLYLLGGRYVDTENAYLKAPMTAVAADVSGRITRVFVDRNAPVEAGQRLLRIDPQPYRVALRQARARLREARSRIETLKADYNEQQAKLDVARTDAAFAQREFARQQKLAARGLTSPSELDRYQQKRDHSAQQLQTLKQGLARIRAQLDGDPDIAVSAHPQYQEAEAARDQAALDLKHTVVRAPFAGKAAKVPDPGTYAATGKPLLSVVGERHPWVEANFKETQLTHMQPKQDVSIAIDAYPDQTWHGHVKSIAQATGAQFSVLPPQNATGNWVKVVQRVPVIIELDERSNGPPLRAGLSVTVTVDTGSHPRGPAFLAPLTAWLQTHLLPAPARAEPQ